MSDWLDPEENPWAWITWGCTIFVIGAGLIVVVGLTLHYAGI